MAVRTKMRKEVTFTTVKVARMSVSEEGVPSIENLDDIQLLGNRNLEQAQKIVHREQGKDVTVLKVVADTKTYEMDVMKFIEVADEIVPNEDEEKEEEK